MRAHSRCNAAPESDEFARTALQSFGPAGFAAPRPGEACVLVCDSSAWTGHIAAAENLLDAGERRRAERFRFERDYTVYVLAHALWRVALGACLGTEARHVRLESTSSGQPHLPGTGWATSLSHGGPSVAIAITRAATIGVDIERSPSRMSLEELMPVVCTADEMAVMEQLPAAVREAALLALWTRKEALLKAFGVGLMEAPARLSALSAECVAPPASAPVQVACRALPLESLPGLVGTVALPGAVAAVRVHWLDCPQTA